MIRAMTLLGRSALGSILLAGASALAQERIEPDGPYKVVAESLERLIAREAEAKGLPAVSIALVDDRRIAWARGFGQADPKRGTPATAETVHRVGSVSKLFTDVAVMQLVERGVLDLDSPVERYLPEFRPKNPSQKPITLRQLMAHRSGLVRESPVGHYFDPTGPSLAETVKSLNATTLVYEPGSRTKYSNAAIATIGYVIERTQGEPFALYVERAVLDPLGLERTGFEPSPAMAKSLAKGRMWTYDGRSFEAPTFPLGTSPAGNLYSTAIDLGRFLGVLFAGGAGPGGRVLEPETIRRMWTPQFAEEGATRGFGLGFMIDALDGHRRVGHSGAVYGFATDLAALPDEKLGVAVVVTRDCANGVARRIADTALRLMLAARAGKDLPAIETTTPVAPSVARRLEGRYSDGKLTLDLSARQGTLFLMPLSGGSRDEIRRLGGDLIVDGLFAFSPSKMLREEGDRLVLGRDSLKRASLVKPEPPPERWQGLIGEYGWDHNILYVLELDGRLYALIEWFFLYPLEEVSADVFAFPRSGLYDGERLIFTRDANGRATQVEAASVVFRRRRIDGEDGSTFRITPLRPVAELRPIAMAAEPPKEAGEFRAPDLVDLTTLDGTIRLDIRYASANNFLGTPLYTTARAFLQRPAAEALVRAHRALGEEGYGLLIHDAYRPWHVTKLFWDATPEASRIFVANPAQGSRHNRGCAVDLTLYDLRTGRPVPMVGGYDEFSDRSNPDYPGGTSLQRWHRDRLRRAMEQQGFTVNEVEWWHFDFRDWPRYPILNLPFETLATSARPK
jgi:CubicO group peptidase (beta-lactamase class C family)/D-alanyl-D-alanine dipeptidase